MNTELDRIPSHLFWMAGKGRLTPSEPLYAVQLIDPESGVAIAIAEAETLDEAVCAVLSKYEGGK